jgi:hypothetical protein
MKSKTRKNKMKSKSRKNKMKPKSRKGGFPIDIIDYKSPQMINYNTNYLEKGYLNIK